MDAEIGYQAESDYESGFRESPSSDVRYTMDQVVMLNQIKKAVEHLEGALDKIQALWRERERDLGHKMQLSELETAMKTVSF